MDLTQPPAPALRVGWQRYMERVKMKMMIFSMAICLLSVGQAQTILTVQGQLLAGNDPIVGHTVFWETEGTYWNGQTDEMGRFNFIDTVNTTAGIGEISLLDCHWDTLRQTHTFVHGLDTALEFHFQFCDTLATNLDYSLEGSLFLSDTLPFSPAIAQVWLLQHDTISNQLNYRDSAYTTTGSYHFEGLPMGTYLIRGSLISSSKHARDFMPTYLGGGLFWQEAISSVLNQAHNIQPNLVLQPTVPHTGPGTIQGSILYLQTPAAPVANATVLILDSLDQAVAFTRSQSNGQYSLSGLSEGYYQVFVEIPGKMAIGHGLSITNQTLNQVGVDFVVDLVQTQIATPATFSEGELAQGLRVFPNPAQGNIILELESGPAQDGLVQMLDRQGRVLYREAVQKTSGSFQFVINLSPFATGMYTLQWITQTQVWNQKIIKL